MVVVLESASRPLVSIGMPVRNNARTIRVALQSLYNQTFRDWELILVDDGSIDDTTRLLSQVRDQRVQVIYHAESRGLSTRLNEAIARSAAPYFARMDGDDVSYPDRLRLQFAFMESNRAVDLLGGGIIVFSDDGRAAGRRRLPLSHTAICKHPHSGFPMAHPTYFGRIEFFRRFGYRTDATLYEDQDLLLRAYRHARFANLPDIVLGYREEGLKLRKLLSVRKHVSCGLWRELRKQGDPMKACVAVAGQVAKGCADTAAVASQLDYRVLRHRARRLERGDLEGWIKVLHMLHQGEAVYHARPS